MPSFIIKFKYSGLKVHTYDLYRLAYPHIRDYAENLRKKYVAVLKAAVIENEYSPKHSWFKVGRSFLKRYPYYTIVQRKVNKLFRRSPVGFFTVKEILPVKFKFVVGYDLNICPYAEYVESGTKLRRIYARFNRVLKALGKTKKMAFVPWWDTNIAVFTKVVKHKAKGKFLIKKVHKLMESLLILGYN